ncbi:MAG: hypothetical protein HY658_03800 [Actinobacteria bacterium]|nr:hypothetical protein [Actinomycetota bacterium]
MSVQEQAAGTCHVHPGTPAVAVCDRCGRPVCLACAVPVRGRVIGQECLPEVLGDPEVPEPTPARPRRPRALTATLGASLAAFVSTGLPWSVFGYGSGPFGAFGLTPRWAWVATIAAPVGLLGAAVPWLRRRAPSSWVVPWAVLEASAGLLVAAGAVLHVLRPPSFTEPAVGPWVALAAGLGAAVAAGATLRAARRPRRLPG